MRGGGDEGVNPGESFIVMTSDLFTLAGGYTASFGTQVDGDAVSVSTSGDRVTITAETAGEATIHCDRDGEGRRVLVHAFSDRVERCRNRVPRDGGRQGAGRDAGDACQRHEREHRRGPVV